MTLEEVNRAIDVAENKSAALLDKVDRLNGRATGQRGPCGRASFGSFRDAMLHLTSITDKIYWAEKHIASFDEDEESAKRVIKMAIDSFNLTT